MGLAPQDLKRRAGSALAAAALAAGGLIAAPATEVQNGLWLFQDPAEPFRAAAGGLSLGFREGASASYRSGVRAGLASRFGLPLIEGRDVPVLFLPAAAPSDGLTLLRGGPLSNYTLVFDLLIPAEASKKYVALFQADPENRRDANFFVQDRRDGGIGFGGVYNGTFRHGEWNRVALSVRSARGLGGVGHVNQYINGRFVGGANTPWKSDGTEPWRLGPRVLLFADDDGDAAPVYVRGVQFIERALFREELAALGGPSAEGLPHPGPSAPAPPRAAARRAAVIAHRGGCGERPENTLAALRHAFESGADHAEVDVQLSADGVAFLMHDQTLDRTTDGRGAASALTMAQLRRLDAGAWFDERFRGEKVPTLAEALAVAKGRGRLLLDVKDAGMGRAIRRALRKASVGPEAVWLEQNVSREALDNFRRHIPGAEILWMSLPADEREFAELKERGVAGFELEFGKFTKEFVDRAHGHGLKVYTYTLFNERSLLRALELGVDGFETDYPDRFDEWMPPRN